MRALHANKDQLQGCLSLRLLDIPGVCHSLAIPCRLRTPPARPLSRRSSCWRERLCGPGSLTAHKGHRRPFASPSAEQMPAQYKHAPSTASREVTCCCSARCSFPCDARVACQVVTSRCEQARGICIGNAAIEVYFAHTAPSGTAGHSCRVAVPPLILTIHCVTWVASLGPGFCKATCFRGTCLTRVCVCAATAWQCVRLFNKKRFFFYAGLCPLTLLQHTCLRAKPPCA